MASSPLTGEYVNPASESQLLNIHRPKLIRDATTKACPAILMVFNTNAYAHNTTASRGGSASSYQDSCTGLDPENGSMCVVEHTPLIRARCPSKRITGA